MNVKKSALCEFFSTWDAYFNSTVVIRAERTWERVRHKIGGWREGNSIWVSLTTENLFRSSNWVMYSRLNVHEIVCCVFILFRFHVVHIRRERRFSLPETKPPDSLDITSCNDEVVLESLSTRATEIRAGKVALREQQKRPNEWKCFPSTPSHESASEATKKNVYNFHQIEFRGWKWWKNSI